MTAASIADGLGRGALRITCTFHASTDRNVAELTVCRPCAARAGLALDAQRSVAVAHEAGARTQIVGVEAHVETAIRDGVAALMDGAVRSVDALDADVCRRCAVRERAGAVGIGQARDAHAARNVALEPAARRVGRARGRRRAGVAVAALAACVLQGGHVEAKGLVAARETEHHRDGPSDRPSSADHRAPATSASASARAKPRG